MSRQSSETPWYGSKPYSVQKSNVLKISLPTPIPPLFAEAGTSSSGVVSINRSPAARRAGTNQATSPSAQGSAATPATSSSSTPPHIIISGNNPAHINIGDTYQDLGAIITAPEQDKNLGIKIYLNGALVSDIVLNTSTTTTDTIDYVATDTNGLTSTTPVW